MIKDEEIEARQRAIRLQKRERYEEDRKRWRQEWEEEIVTWLCDPELWGNSSSEWRECAAYIAATIESGEAVRK